jgi:hypothetical protein
MTTSSHEDWKPPEPLLSFSWCSFAQPRKARGLGLLEAVVVALGLSAAGSPYRETGKAAISTTGLGLVLNTLKSLGPGEPFAMEQEKPEKLR